MGITPREGTANPPIESGDLLDRFVTSIYDQGASQGCVGFSTGQAIRTRWGLRAFEANRSNAQICQPSPSVIWWLARQTHGAEGSNSPTYIREAFKRIRAIGICPESEYPSDDAFATFADKPSPEAFRASFDRRSPTAYYRIDGTDSEKIRGIKIAIARGYPVVFGASISESFLNWDGKGAYDDLGNAIVGGHAMVATGYSEDGVRGPNSWGQWGNNGWFLFSWRFAAERFRDCWAVDLPPIYEVTQ